MRGQLDRPAQSSVHPASPVDLRTGGYVAEVALDQTLRFGQVEVAHNGQARVVRDVEASEERLNVFERGVVEVFGRADGGPVVRVGSREQSGLDQHLRHAVWTVFVVLTSLVLDHVALDVELAVGEHFQQVSHPVGLQPEGELEVVGRDVFPVVGAVCGGGAIQVGADLLERLEVALVVVLGAFEHDVLEQVGKAGLAGLFVF